MAKFALLVRANAETETDAPFDSTVTETMLNDMMVYNNSLADAGALLSADGFHNSVKGARVHFSSKGDEPTVEPGPFEHQTLISGYWIIKAENLDEAIAWAKKVPFKGDDDVVEVRKINGMEDFGELATDAMKAREEELKKKVEKNAA